MAAAWGDVAWGGAGIRAFVAGGLLAVSGWRGAAAQVVAPDTSVEAALQSLASRAGSAFVGEVVAVRPVGGMVEVEFHVEQTLLGAAAGTYTVREWGGLWAAGQRRYWVGERAAVFLLAPGKGGLSSPVDGMEGVLPVAGQSPAGEPLLDVRRLAARVVRPMGAPLYSVGNGTLAVSEVAKFIAPGPKLPRLPKPEPEPVGLPGPEPGPDAGTVGSPVVSRGGVAVPLPQGSR